MKENVLVVSYGSREAAMVDALYRSAADFCIHVADKQRNPFNYETAQKTGGRHQVVPDLSVEGIYDFAKEIERLRFVLCGSEGPIINGLTDRIEDSLGVPVIAPRQEYAIESSKLRQRELVGEAAPEANIAYSVFRRNCPAGQAREFMRSLGYNIVIKPVNPTAGKGVVVSGDHFDTEEEAHRLFAERIADGDVIVEEKVDGEESSFMAFCDGTNIVPVRATRDYKRAFDDDKGPNTGGMGSYMDANDWLPFMTEADYVAESGIVQRIFEKMGGNYGLKGMPFYVAFMHTKDGPKILEINSRPGDPEFMNVSSALETDFGEICYGIVEGNLREIKIRPVASVVTYLVPQTYGGKTPDWDGDRKVSTRKLREMMLDRDENLRVYPGSMEMGDDVRFYMMKSRTLALVGIGETIEEARKRSVGAADLVEGDLWRRTDIASPEHIQKSIEHARELRARK
ncbi:MAG: ATP-grasp domain-containing protein [Candidatus Aenigmarchaeota archaeon]|nr:ATP-grasp domain-containing protein [Candidatus Aenigmarchaeota archaeon]